MLGRQLHAVKSEKKVTEVTAAAVAPDSVHEHVDSVMHDLTVRQRREVQRRIDMAMRGAAERMGWRTMAEKQELVERTNAAIADALTRKAHQEDCADDNEVASLPIDSEYDMALRAKVRLAMQAAWDRHSKETEPIEESMRKATQAAWDRSEEKAQAFYSVEFRILSAAQEACRRRGSTTPTLSFPARVTPTKYSSAPKSTIKIADDKIDDCIHKILEEAKERKQQTNMVARHGPRAVGYGKDITDVELHAYIAKIAQESKERAERSLVQQSSTKPNQVTSAAASGHAPQLNYKLNKPRFLVLEPLEPDEESDNESDCGKEVAQVRSPKKWGGC